MIPALDITPARTAHLHQNQYSSLLFNLIAGALMAYVLWFHEPASTVLWWLGGLWVTALPRLWWLWRYQRCGSGAATPYWENGYALACFANGLAWAAMFLVFSPRDGFVVAIMNLTGAAFGFVAIATLSTSLRSYLALIVPIAAAQTLWIYRFYQGEAFAALMLGGFYFVVMTIGLLVFRRALLGAMHDHHASQMLLLEQQAVFNSSLIGLALSRQCIFVRVNEEFARIYGFTREEMEGRENSLIYPDRESWIQDVHAIDANLATGEKVVYEREYLRPDGQKRWLQA